jgi:hypothetical protein
MNVQGNRKEADDSLEHQLAAAYREIQPLRAARDVALRLSV